MISQPVNSLVSIACVPDTGTNFKITADGKSIVENNLRWIISPYDEIALAEAIRVRELRGGAVTVVSIGPENVKTSLRECLALGADKAIWLRSHFSAARPGQTRGQAPDRVSFARW